VQVYGQHAQHVDIAQSLNNLGIVLARQGQLHHAVAFLRDAYAMFVAKTSAAHATAAKIKQNYDTVCAAIVEGAVDAERVHHLLHRLNK
jgi:hypothetical protein